MLLKRIMKRKVCATFKLLVVMTLLLECTAESCDQCSNTAAKFSVTSSRDNTGHWTTQVQELGVEEITNDTQQTGECSREGIKKIEIEAMTVVPQHNANPEYKYFPDIGYYKFHTNPVTWDQARKICEEENAYLAIINSEAEAQVMKDLMASCPNIEGAVQNEYAFIGFHSRFVEGEYLTIHDTDLKSTGYYTWACPGYPDNNGGTELCGSVDRNGGLNDITCNNTQPFFCEQYFCDSAI